MTRRALPWVALAVSALAVLLVLSRLPGRDLVRAGTDAWDQGDVPAAIEAWSEPAASPLASAAVHFNLGDAYYRDGDLPRALAHWRHAHRKRPRDPALVHNIALARSQLDGVPRAVGPAVGWMELATPVELGVLAVLLLIGFSLLAAQYSRRREGKLTLAGLAVAGGFLGVVAVHGAAVQRAHPVAVVVDTSAVVRAAARAEAPEQDLLPAGTEVLVHGSLAGFYLVQTGDGERGWVPVGALWSPQLASSRGSQASTGPLSVGSHPG